MEQTEVANAQMDVMRASDALEKCVATASTVQQQQQQQQKLRKQVEQSTQRLAEVKEKFKTLRDGAFVARVNHLRGVRSIGSNARALSVELMTFFVPTYVHSLKWIHTLILDIPYSNTEGVKAFCEYLEDKNDGRELPFLKSLHLCGSAIQYDTIGGGMRDRRWLCSTILMHSLRRGRRTYPPDVTKALVNVLTTSKTFQGLNELFVSFVIGDWQSTQPLARWVVEHRNLQSLYLITYPSMSNEFCRYMVRASFEEKNHTLVDFCTLPCWSKESTTVRNAVRRNAAELQRSALHVLQNNDSTGWSPLSFHVYKNHPALPSLVAEMGMMSVGQAKIKIEEVPKLSFDQFEQSLNALSTKLGRDVVATGISFPPQSKKAHRAEETQSRSSRGRDKRAKKRRVSFHFCLQ